MRRALPVAALLLGAAVAVLLKRPPPPPPPPPPAPSLLGYQKSYRELPPDEQRVYFSLRSAITTAERVRANTKHWPEPAGLSGEGLAAFSDDRLEWTKREAGLYVNYLGVPKGRGLRWLVLVIEPDPKQLKLPNEPPPPVDIEHHTLADGTALHVTVWSAPNTGPLPVTVVPFPVADGWTERR